MNLRVFVGSGDMTES